MNFIKVLFGFVIGEIYHVKGQVFTFGFLLMELLCDEEKGDEGHDDVTEDPGSVEA